MNKRNRNRMLKLFLCMLIVASIFTSSSVKTTYAANFNGTFKDINQSHWAYSAIYQSINDGIVEGYEDETFRPNQDVSATEFIVMFYRAYQDELTLQAETSNWKQPYISLANEKNWNINASKSTLSRGEVAQFIYSVLEGKHAQTTEAITYMLYQQYSNGLTSATVAGYGQNTLLNRAQAVTFIQNIKQKVPSLSSYMPLKDGELKVPKEPALYADIYLRDVQLGESESSLIYKLGKPNRQFTVDNVSYYSYNADYEQYALYIVANKTVQGMYSNAKSVWQSNSMKLVGDSASSKLQGNIDEGEIVYYTDKHKNNTIDAILVATLEDYIPSYNSTKQEITEVAMQNFDITNAFRVKNGLPALQWHAKLAQTAQKYSEYMYKNEHFNHYDLEGNSPFDRMEKDGIDYWSAGENIAFGYGNAMDVNNGWINSLGHRNNILGDQYEYIGIGVHELYYTQNFIGY